MIRVDVRLYAVLHRYAPVPLRPGEPLPLDLPAGSTVADLVAHLNLPADQVKRIFVNHCAVPEEHLLQDGDRVSVFPVVAGG